MKPLRSWLTVGAVGAMLSCSEGVGPNEVALEFSASPIVITDGGFTVVALENVGTVAVGPIQLLAGPVTGPSPSETVISGARLVVTPAEIPTMNPGDVREVSIALQGAESLFSGQYGGVISAILAERVAASVTARYDAAAVPGGTVTSVTVVQVPAQAVQGDVHELRAEARDSSGALVEDIVTWRVVPNEAGLTTPDGRFVGFLPGDVKIIAVAGPVADTAVVQVSSRGLSGSFSVVGHGEVNHRFSSDLWLVGDAAYTGTWQSRTTPDGGTKFGNTLYVWDISDPANPIRTDSVSIIARVVNDVKVRAAGDLAVITHEGSDDGLNGVTLLDLTDPHHPVEITRFSEELSPGVHNAWVEDAYVYLVVDGIGSGLRVLDVMDPAAPSVASQYYAGTSFLHDVYVRDGLAFLSHWDAGLVILDVGGGGQGGSPTALVELGRILIAGGQSHNAWYWPERKLVFVGEEDFGTPGVMHVVDVSDLSSPAEVATFTVPSTTPHNFWLDEVNEVLYLAWYSAGIVALDVSGELLGPLDRQGRQIARCQYGGSGACAGAGTNSTWAPQLHNGLIWVSDMNSGIWSLRLDRP